MSVSIPSVVTSFALKVAIRMYLKWHNGPSHDRAERLRKELKEIDDEKANRVVDSGK